VTRHTAKGAAFTAMVLEVFRLHGQLMAAGTRLGRGLDLTASRWQVLGALALESRALTVAEIGRAMGMTRQGVQRVVLDVEAAGLVRRVPHSGNRRARPVELSRRGRAVYAEISRRQAPWANRCAEALTGAELDALVRNLRRVGQAVGSEAAGPQRAAPVRAARKGV